MEDSMTAIFLVILIVSLLLANKAGRR